LTSAQLEAHSLATAPRLCVDGLNPESVAVYPENENLENFFSTIV
jgi:hypothetical protein